MREKMTERKHNPIKLVIVLIVTVVLIPVAWLLDVLHTAVFAIIDGLQEWANIDEEDLP